MHIALNGWFLDAPATGSGQYLRQLVRTLIEIAPSAGLTLIAPRRDATLPVTVQTARPSLSRVGENLGKVQFEQLTFPRLCRRGGFDVAHVPYLGPPYVPSIPTVVTVHDLIPLILPEYRGSLAVRTYTRLASAGARRATFLIADSESTRRDIDRRLGIRGERVRVIYLAADPHFHPIEDLDERARVRVKYNLPLHFVLYLGGLDVRKNLAVLIEAWAALRREHAAGWKLVIAGKLPEENSAFFPDPRPLAEKLRVRDNVQFIGPVSEQDKPALYSTASAFAFPSRYEGFGLPPLEAMACGTPVLCANASSLPEVVGDAGVLLNPSKVDEWVEALRAVMTNPTRVKDWRERGLAQAARFSWDKTARETLHVYREAVSVRQVGNRREAHG